MVAQEYIALHESRKEILHRKAAERDEKIRIDVSALGNDNSWSNRRQNEITYSYSGGRNAISKIDRMIYVRQKHSLTHLEDSTVTFHDRPPSRAAFRSILERGIRQRSDAANHSFIPSKQFPERTGCILDTGKRRAGHEVGESRRNSFGACAGNRRNSQPGSAVNQPDVCTEKFSATGRSIRIQWPGL